MDAACLKARAGAALLDARRGHPTSRRLEEYTNQAPDGQDAVRIWRALEVLRTDCGPDAREALERLGLGDAFDADVGSGAAEREKVPTAAQIKDLIAKGRWRGKRPERLFRARRLWLGLVTDALLGVAGQASAATRAAARMMPRRASSEGS